MSTQQETRTCSMGPGHKALVPLANLVAACMMGALSILDPYCNCFSIAAPCF